MEPGVEQQRSKTGIGLADDAATSDVIDIESRVFSALGYLPLLFVIPLWGGRGEEYQRFHGRQSLLLFLAFSLLWTAVWLLGLILGRVLGDAVLIGFVFRGLACVLRSIGGTLLSLGYLALMLAGIVTAASGHRWTMPFVGRFAKRNVNP